MEYWLRSSFYKSGLSRLRIDFSNKLPGVLSEKTDLYDWSSLGGLTSLMIKIFHLYAAVECDWSSTKIELENFLPQENSINLALVAGRFHLKWIRTYSVHFCHHSGGKTQGNSAFIVKNRIQYSVERKFDAPSMYNPLIFIEKYQNLTRRTYLQHWALYD